MLAAVKFHVTKHFLFVPGVLKGSLKSYEYAALLVGRSVGKELARMWKEVVLFEFYVLFRCLPLVIVLYVNWINLCQRSWCPDLDSEPGTPEFELWLCPAGVEWRPDLHILFILLLLFLVYLSWVPCFLYFYENKLCEFKIWTMCAKYVVNLVHDLIM
jgi:hypothetical protein